jgi:hypothetical protein
MKPDAADSETPRQAKKPSESLIDSAMLENVRMLWQQLRDLGYDHLLLAALETRRAGESLVAMLVAGIILAILATSAWLGLLAAAVLGLIENGMLARNAILLAVAFNLLLVLLVCAVIRRKSYYLQFPAILDCLQPKPRNTE